ncbi:hypothetical protein CRG98_033037 [Punica granatum]|uniref:Uncharacterized protein n=1 Tax=Punica granatum TaxID=22663 RepID=A0A2I0IRS0_PUNGR|nr:hypothetical protein CRG98_033037 [Punica granatum]
METNHIGTKRCLFYQAYALHYEKPKKYEEAEKTWYRSGVQKEDTAVCKFVGSAILDDPMVENVCHHGLVDPTIDLKEAVKDINSIFRKPIKTFFGLKD